MLTGHHGAGMYDQPGAALPVIDATDAERLHRQASADRATAAAARAEADNLLAEARARAERVITDAQHRARALTAAAECAEQRAQAAQERADLLTDAVQLTAEAEDAEAACVALRGEYVRLTAQVETITARIAALEQSRREAHAEPRQASAGRLAALGELISELQRREAESTARLRAIIAPDGTGELSEAVAIARQTIIRSEAARRAAGAQTCNASMPAHWSLQTGTLSG